MEAKYWLKIRITILLVMLTPLHSLAQDFECTPRTTVTAVGYSTEIGPELYHNSLNIKLPSIPVYGPWNVSMEFIFGDSELVELMQLVYGHAENEVKIYNLINSTTHKIVNNDTNSVTHVISWNNSNEVPMGGSLFVKFLSSSPDVGYSRLLINNFPLTCLALVAPIPAPPVDKPEDWPWLAGIYSREEDGLTFRCGGSLVSKRVVITAAHCLQEEYPDGTFYPRPAGDFVVALGRYYMKSWGENDLSESRIVRDVIVHPEYTGLEDTEADIAAMVLMTPIFETKYIKPVPLYSDAIVLNDPRQQNFKWTMKGTVVGWSTDDQGNVISELPHFTYMPIVPDEECLYTDELFEIVKANKTFCAGHKNGTTSCTGDNGGALYVKRTQGEWYLRGIVSVPLSANGSCDAGNFTVFTDIDKYQDWIKNITEKYDDISPTAVKNVGPESWPWVVPIYQATVHGLQYKCSGTLISDLHVITVIDVPLYQASECLTNGGVHHYPPAEDLVVSVGRQDLNMWTGLDGSQTRTVDQLYIIPSLDRSTVTGDNLAVLELSTPVYFNLMVQPAPIWFEQDVPRGRSLEDSRKAHGTVVTWFKDKFGRVPRDLKQTNVTIVPDTLCVLPGQIHRRPNTFCASYGTGSGLHLPNTGGGLYTYEKVSCDPYADWMCKYGWVLRGIVSTPRDPQVSRDSNYVPFIDVYKHLPLLQNIPKLQPWLRVPTPSLYDVVSKLAHDDPAMKMHERKKNMFTTTCAKELERQREVNKNQTNDIKKKDEEIESLKRKVEMLEEKLKVLESVLIDDEDVEETTMSENNSTVTEDPTTKNETATKDDTTDKDEINGFEMSPSPERTTPLPGKLNKEMKEDKNTTSDTMKTNPKNTKGDKSKENEQKALKMKTFKIFEKKIIFYGENHPDTINLAYDFVNKFGNSNPALALDIYNVMLMKRVELYGEDSLETINTLQAIAGKLIDAFKYNEALNTFEKIFEIKLRVLGLNHIDTLSTMSNIAFTFNLMHDYKEALEIYKTILEVQRRFFGNDHNAINRTKGKILITARDAIGDLF